MTEENRRGFLKVVEEERRRIRELMVYDNPVVPMPCVRDEHGKINYQSVKALFLKINEELDELKEAVCGYHGAQVDFDENVMHESTLIGVDDKKKIAEEAADTITAITTMLDALGINAGMRAYAQRRVNEKNQERGRL